MFFSIFLILIILLVAFVHYVQGFFSATISAVLAVFAAVLAVSYHETLVESLLQGKVADMAHAMSLLILFAAIYMVPRVLFDMLVPGNVRVPPLADKIGAAAMGLIAGLFAAGVVALAAQEMPFFPSMWGYSRFATETKEVTTKIPGHSDIERTMVDVLSVAGVEDPVSRNAADVERGSLIVPADDILVNMVARLSDGGSLEGSQPLTRIHPDWLTELFGQRLGIEPGAKRVAMNLPGKTQVNVAGVYQLHPETLAQREGEEFSFRLTPHALPIQFKDQTRILVAIRVIFGPNAADPDGIVRFSPGSVRLVTRAPAPGGGQETQFVDYFPVGTLDDAHFLYISRPDDFLFVNDKADKRIDPVTAKEVPLDSSKDKGADLVFWVQKKGFVDPPNPKPGQVMKVAPETFLEVKRMARMDLSGQEIRPNIKPDPQIALVRKIAVVKGPTTGPSTRPTTSPSEPIGPRTALGEKIVGSWQQVDLANGEHYTFDQNGTCTLSIGLLHATGKPATLTGKWREVSAAGNALTVHTDSADTEGHHLHAEYTITPTDATHITVRYASGTSIPMTKVPGPTTKR